MRFIVSVSVLAIVMLWNQGCNSSSNTRTSYARDAYIQPVVDPVSVGVGSMKYTKTCDRSFARVEYVFQEDMGIDPLSFVFQHSVDGQSFDVDDGSSNSNGSLVRVKDAVLIKANDTEHGIAHKIGVTYLNDGVYVLDEFTFVQPACADEPDETEIVDENVTVYGCTK